MISIPYVTGKGQEDVLARSRRRRRRSWSGRCFAQGGKGRGRGDGGASAGLGLEGKGPADACGALTHVEQTQASAPIVFGVELLAVKAHAIVADRDTQAAIPLDCGDPDVLSSGVFSHIADGFLDDAEYGPLCRGDQTAGNAVDLEGGRPDLCQTEPAASRALVHLQTLTAHPVFRTDWATTPWLSPRFRQSHHTPGAAPLQPLPVRL